MSSSLPARTRRRASPTRSTSSASAAIQQILLEGGPHLAGVFLDAGEIDEARIFVAPLLAGGRDAKAALGAEGVENIGDAIRAVHTAVERIDDDVLITARMKEW